LAKREKLFENLQAGDGSGNSDHEMTTPTIPTEGRTECSRLRVVNLKKKKPKNNPRQISSNSAQVSRASWEAKRLQESYKCWR